MFLLRSKHYCSSSHFLLFVGPPITQSSLINNRDQPGTSAVPNLAPVGARLPPPLPQNLLYTVSERKYTFDLLPGESQGQGSCRLWGRKESDMTKET